MTSIGQYAFDGCNNLTSITIPESVTTIGYYAFNQCSSLSSITIGDNVTSIGLSAFEGTPWFNDLPDGVVYLGKVAYQYKGKMPKNTELVLKDGTVAISGGAFSGRELGSVIIPNSVISIDNYAFGGCTGLTSLNIPNSVINIGDHAFSNCSGLTSINMGSGLTTIGYSAFIGCTGLTSITIPNSVDSIGEKTFANCAGLTSVTLSKNLRCIENEAFYGCTSLTSITIPNNVISIGLSTFADCTDLSSIDIPNSVAYIDGYAFEGTRWYNDQPEGIVYAGNVAYKYKGTMPSGSKLVIKEGTTGITRDAFYECTDLTSIDIPNSVTKIGYQAFFGCASLMDVYCRPEEVPFVGNLAFYDIARGATLHVPAVSLDLYKTSSISGFTYLVALTDDDPTSMIKHSLKSNDNNYPVEIYSIDGKRISQPQRGLNILRMNDGKTIKRYLK